MSLVILPNPKQQNSAGVASAEVVTATPITGHTAVYIDSTGQAKNANYNDNTALHVVGIATNSASAGGVINIQKFGDITENSWTWTLGPVYLGLNGALTQTPPAGGTVVIIGEAISPTTVLVRIMTPILGL